MSMDLEPAGGERGIYSAHDIDGAGVRERQTTPALFFRDGKEPDEHWRGLPQPFVLVGGTCRLTRVLVNKEIAGPTPAVVLTGAISKE